MAIRIGIPDENYQKLMAIPFFGWKSKKEKFSKTKVALTSRERVRSGENGCQSQLFVDEIILQSIFGFFTKEISGRSEFIYGVIYGVERAEHPNVWQNHTERRVGLSLLEDLHRQYGWCERYVHFEINENSLQQFYRVRTARFIVKTHNIQNELLIFWTIWSKQLWRIQTDQLVLRTFAINFTTTFRSLEHKILGSIELYSTVLQCKMNNKLA